MAMISKITERAQHRAHLLRAPLQISDVQLRSGLFVDEHLRLRQRAWSTLQRQLPRSRPGLHHAFGGWPSPIGGRRENTA